MNPKEIENIHHKIFEEIKNIDSDGKEHYIYISTLVKKERFFIADWEIK